MNLRVFFSIIISFAVVIFACSYLYLKDRYDKESKKLLLLLFATGGITGIAAFFIESLLTNKVLTRIFQKHIMVTVDGMIAFTSTSAEVWFYLIQNVVVSSLIIIFIKALVLILLTRKNKNFNSLFDGTIYSCYIFLSAALLESICFAVTTGWDLFMGHFFLNVCIQLFIAVLVGYYYTMWYLNSLASTVEKELNDQGIIKTNKYINPHNSLITGILLAIILCGTFGFINDFAIVYRSLLSTCLVLAALILSMRTISLLSKQDTADELIASRILLRKHKELSDKKELVINAINKHTN